MKKYILFMFAVIACLQAKAQVMEVWLTTDPTIGSSTDTKSRACKDGSGYTYTVESYKETSNSKNTMVLYQTKGDTKTVVNTFGGSQNLLFSDKYYQVRIYNKSCVWGNVPTDDQGICLGQTKTENGITYELIWAPWNLGASSSENSGCYFAWGENGSEYAYNSDYTKEVTSGSTSYTKDSYRGCYDENNTTTTNTMDDAHDPAVQWWGNGWRTPTAEEISWLQSNTSIAHNGINSGSYKLTSTYKNEDEDIDYTSNSIVIPRCDWYKDAAKQGENTNPRAILLSRTEGTIALGYDAWIVYKSNPTLLYVENYEGESMKYYMGQSIRPVKWRKIQ